MPTFHYTAKIGPVQRVTGTIDATSEQEAIAVLLKNGKTPIDIRLDANNLPDTVRKGNASVKTANPAPLKISGKVMVVFIRQLADLTDSGVPIIRSLDVLRAQKGMLPLKDVIGQMTQQIKEGKSLSQAMAGFPKIFSAIIVGMVKAGESSGTLGDVLGRLAQTLEADLVIVQKIKSAMTYPMMVLGVGTMTLLVLLIFVLPRLTGLFEDMDMQLPLATQIVIGTSHFLAQWWWLLGIGIAGVGFLGYRWSQSLEGRQQIDQVFYNNPWIVLWIKDIELGRWSRMMSTLVHGGMTLVTALETAQGVCDNTVIRQKLKDVTLSVKSGRSLSVSLKSVNLFDDLPLSLLSVGEESAQMANAFAKVATMHERDGNQRSSLIADVAGPLILIVIVGFVGTIILSMLLPIFQMNLAVQ